MATRTASTYARTRTRARTGHKRGNGEGNIRLRADGRYEARATVNGQSRSFYGATRKDVQEKLTAALHDVQRGITLPDGRQTVGRFMTDWLESVARPRLRPNIYTRYALDVRRINAGIGTLKLKDLTPQAVQTFLNGLDLSPASIHHCRAVLRTALKTAEDWNLIYRNPAGEKRVTTPRVPRSAVEARSAEDARAILAAFAGHDLEAFVHVALATGMREGELLGLRWDDVDLTTGMVEVRLQLQRGVLGEPKSRTSIRRLQVPPETVAVLRAHRTRQREQQLRTERRWKDGGYVFTTSVGTPYQPSNLIRAFARRLHAAGLPPMRIHDLRHTYACVMLEHGVDLKTLSDRLGHSQISITADLYAKVGKTLRDDAAARMGTALLNDN